MRLRGCVFVLAVASFAVLAGPAQAAPFANNSPIALAEGDCGTATQAPATPYGSQIPVSGLTGNVTDVNVTLRDITSDFTPDLRVLLVGPTGAKTLVMHEIPNDNETVGQTWTFDDEAAGPPPTYSAATGTYKPAQVDDDDYGCSTVSASDSLPAPAPSAPYSGALSAFDGTAANGTWTLYVASEGFADPGVIEGWCLEIATAANAAQSCTTPGGISINDGLECDATDGTGQQPGSPYPSVRASSGLSGQVTDVNLTLQRYSHSHPDDTLMLLVGPGGQKVLVMNYDGGGGNADDATFTLDDEAGAPIPNPIVSGTYLPSADADPGEFCDDTTSFVAPAPPGPYAAGLSSFDGSSPNGDWKLYVVDAVDADYGDIEGWCVQVTTTANAATNFCTPPGVLGPYAGAVLADNPAGYWRFGEASGTTAVDSSPNHNDGTYLNGPVLGVPGALVADANTAASFDGVNDSVRVPDANSLDVGDTFTLEGWAKRTNATKSIELFNKGGNGLQLTWMNAANGGQIWLRKANVTTIARSAIAVPSDGLFHHIVATKNGPGAAVIYIDGAPSTVVLSTTQVIANTAFPLTFTGAGAPPHTLDEFALYDGVLSPSQVAAHHLAGIGGGGT
jgi:subtilisin-like proprotein convertase family protein